MKNCFFLFLGFFLAIQNVTASTCTWIGGNGNWHKANKWSCGKVPGPGDDVIILSGTITRTSPVTVKSLTISGGELTVMGDLTITGQLVWEGGQIRGFGNTIVNGGAIFQGSQTKYLVDRSITLNGNSTWSDGMISVPQNLAFTIATGVTFEITGDDVLRPVVTNTGVLVNNGTIHKSNGAKTALEIANFTNNGTVSVAMGTLEFRGCESNGGFTIVAPGVLQLHQNTLNLLGSASIAGSGTFVMGNASPVVNVLDNADISCPVDINIGTLNVGHNLNLPSLKMGTNPSITITGTHRLLVLDSVHWNGGQIKDLLGGVRFEGPVIMAGSMKTVENSLVELADSTFWMAGEILLRQNGRIQNLSVFTAEMNTSNVIQQQPNNTGTEFRNDGTMHIGEIDSFQLVEINVPFVNNGPIHVEAGTFQIEEGISNAPITIAAGATMEKSGDESSNFYFQSGTISGAGDLVTSGGNTHFEAGAKLNTHKVISSGNVFIFWPDTIASLTMNGGTIESHADLFIAGSLDIYSGHNTMTGGGKIVTLGGANLVSNGTLTLTNIMVFFPDTITNWVNGNIELGPNGVINVLEGSVFNIDQTQDRTIKGYGSGHQFNNEGTVKNINNTRVAFDPSVEVNNNGIFTGIGTYEFKNPLQNAGTIAPGISTGKLTLAGTVENNSLMEFELQKKAGNTSFDQMPIKGAFTLGGILDVTTSGNVPNGEYVLIHCDSVSNCLTGTFSQTNLPDGATLIYTSDSVILQLASPSYLVNDDNGVANEQGSVLENTVGPNNNFTPGQGGNTGFSNTNSAEKTEAGPIIFPTVFSHSIEVRNNTENEVNLLIFETNGKPVWSGKNIEGRIDLSFLPAGMYLAKTYSEHSNEYAVTKIIRQ